MVTEKERGCHVHILMDGYALFLKYAIKLLETKHFVELKQKFTFFINSIL